MPISSLEVGFKNKESKDRNGDEGSKQLTSRLQRHLGPLWTVIGWCAPERSCIPCSGFTEGEGLPGTLGVPSGKVLQIVTLLLNSLRAVS